MFSRPKILFLVSLLFVALLNPKFNPYLLFKFFIILVLLLKVHKGHLTRSYVHMAIQNISVPYIILPFRILYYFRSVKYTPP